MTPLTKARGCPAQQGAAALFVVVILLFGMALVTAVTMRSGLNQARLSSNLMQADRAAVEADAGLHNALAHMQANGSRITSASAGGWLNASSSPRWQACTPTSTAAPCGTGVTNVYGTGWYRYGPIPQQLTLGNGYSRSSWYLSESIDDAWTPSPNLGCVTLPITPLLPAPTNALLATIGTLIAMIPPGLSLPTTWCLPISFQPTPAPLPATIENPALTIVTRVDNPSDVRSAVAEAQLQVQKASLFAQTPVATITVRGTVNLSGDFRVWGNPRPPTVAPLDFSLLKLRDILGVNASALLSSLLSGGHAATLAPQLGLTTPEVLALDWHVVFPLSIWSQSATTLASNPVGANLLNGARTCLPPFNGPSNSPCATLSQSINIGVGSIAALVPPSPVNLSLKLPDIQDPQNLNSTATGLLNTASPPVFATDLFMQTFGVAGDASQSIKAKAKEVLADCSGLPSKVGGLYWITGNCTLSGEIGTIHGPPLVVVEGNLVLTAGATFHGVVYLVGGTARSITGPLLGTRPNFRGALLSDGNLTGSQLANLVYDVDAVRRAGLSAGQFAPVPGGWSDKWSGP